jgi:hypothetical protein
MNYVHDKDTVLETWRNGSGIITAVLVTDENGELQVRRFTEAV